jgi:oligopeptide transport system ATP-binding protein
MRLISADRGTVRIGDVDLTALDGRALRAQRHRIQMIFQDPFASLNPRRKIGNIISDGPIANGTDPKAAMARARDLLGLVGLDAGALQRYPHEFSGGQRQRIGIARALAVEPALIVCDEPVSALDVSIQAQVINLLRDLQRNFGLSYLFIAHDLAVVKHVADRVAVMYLGVIVEIGPKQSLFSDPRHPYTRTLLAAIPRPDPHRAHARELAGGDPPGPLNPPSGCRFHARCPHAIDRCRSETPMLSRWADGHLVACHRAAELPVADAIGVDHVTQTAARRMALYARRRDTARDTAAD